MHYYQHNIGDYARDTGHLTVLEHGIYRLLLDWCYLNEKPITTEQAIRVSRGNPKETQSVLSEFFLMENDGWIHKRVQKEVLAYHEKVKINRKNGAKGGRPKPNDNPMGSQSGSEINPNHKPITNNHKPINKTVAKKAEAFVLPDWINKTHWDIWHEHPKRKNLSNAQKQLAVDKLAGWKEQGIDYALALENAATNNWQGIFEPDSKKAPSKINKTNNQATTDAAYEKLFGIDAEKDITHESARL